MDNQMKNFMEIIRYAIHNDSKDELPDLIEPVDWEKLEKIFKEHNLFAIFHEVASKFSQYREQPGYQDKVRFTVIMVGQQIKRTEEFLQLYQDFLRNDLHPIVMKGIICRQLYGKHAEQRPSGDEDIYVRKEEFYRVKEVLEARGYVCEFEEVTEKQLDALQEITFQEKESGLVVEVHTNVMGNDNQMHTQMGECFADVFERTQTVVIRGVPFCTMSPTDHFLFLVLHALKHFTLCGVGVRQLMDILLFQKEFEASIDWGMVEEVLKKNHAIRYLGDLQAIGTKYWGIELQKIFATCSPDELLKDSFEFGVFGKMDEVGALASSINVNTMQKTKSKIGFLLQVSFPPLEFMVTNAPYLNDKPWRLPVEWIRRWIRFLKKTRKYNGNLMTDGLKRSQKRKKMFKKYGL